MTLAALWAFLAFALPILAALLAPLSAIDLAYQLRAGGELLDTGVIPTVDTYTFTAAGEPWLNQQWGAQALLAATFRVGGWTGLVLLRAVLVGIVAACVFAAVRRQGLGVRSAAALSIAAFGLAAVAMALRPQLMGMALFALLLLLVVERRRHPAWLWLAPVIVLVWANVHGSFVLGLAVLGLAWLADLHDRSPRAGWTLVVGLVAGAASLVNPFGLQVWTYALGLSTNPLVTEQATEWRPTTLRTPAGIAFFASVLALGGLLLRLGRRVPWPALAWFGLFFLVGAWAVRGAAWWPPAAAVGLAGLLGSGFLGVRAGGPVWPRATGEPRRAVNAVLAGALVVAGVALLPVWRPVDPALGAPTGLVQHAPSGITASLREVVRPGDRIFLPQPWASWTELAVPWASVVVDSRFELFSEAVWTAYLDVSRGAPGALEQLDEWAVDVVVVATGQDALGDELAAQPGWREIHRDGDGVVYVRTDPPA